MGVGMRMKAVLRDRKMTIKELSVQSGIPLNTLYSITKRDSERVDRVVVQRIASVLDIAPGYLTEEIEPKGTYPLKYALLRGKIFECAKAANISDETLCIKLGLPFDEWYRWCEQSSSSFLDHLPQIAFILDVPRKTFEKYLDGSYLDDEREEELLVAFRELNQRGKGIAIERIQELCKIKDYIE